MKRKFSLLALLSLLLLAVMPSGTALAAKPTGFGAVGTIDAIDEGDVSAAGASARFVVKERSIGGVFFGPDLVGPYELIFGTNVPILTQSGQIAGTLTVDIYEAKVSGASELGLTPVPCAVPDGVTCILTPSGNFVPGLLIDGKLTFTDGVQGHGEFSGWLIPDIDGGGHIVGIIAGAISINGKWHN